MLVVDASPLIHLARVSLLDFLHEYDPDREVVVPAVVLEEVMRGASHDQTTSIIEQAARDWLTLVPVPTPHPSLDPFKIDSGEMAVLSLGLTSIGATVVLDDLAARTEADRLGIPKIGTLHLLIEAKAWGRIPSVRAPLDRLSKMGMRLSDALVREVLTQAGE